MMVLSTGTQFIPETGTLQGLEHSLLRPQIEAAVYVIRVSVTKQY